MGCRAICSRAWPSREQTAEAALAAALRPPRAASRNLLLSPIAAARSSTPSVSATTVGVIRGADDMLVHANHLEATELRALETPSENSALVARRLGTLIEGATGPLTVAQIRTFYRDHADHPHSLCAHPFEGRNVKTVASVIGDLDRLRAPRGEGLALPARLRDVHARHLSNRRAVGDGGGPVRRVLTRQARPATSSSRILKSPQAAEH